MPIAAVLLLIFSALGIGGAVVQTATDPTLSSCEHPAWPGDRLPLLITLDPSAKDWASDLEFVAAWWNLQLPGSVLVAGELPWQESAVGVHVKSLPFSAAGQLAGLTTSHLRDCQIYATDIALNTWVMPEQRHWVLAHEIGHALGLGHAPPGSLMQPIAEPAPPVLPNETIRQLRETYPGARP